MISVCICASAQVRVGKTAEGRSVICADGEQLFLKGVAGYKNIGEAVKRGANVFRTYSCDSAAMKRCMDAAEQNGIYVMAGIRLPKDPAQYRDENFRQRMREHCRDLAERYGNDRHILIWALGNELNMNNRLGADEWRFVNELSELIKSIDKRHLTTTVLSTAAAVGNLVEYCPSLDIVCVNSYGSIGSVARKLRENGYTGAYLITEWGVTGWWECPKTAWGAPIEQTSAEKCRMYEKRYGYIADAADCAGSFVFLWGQKEERTPTWFGLFVENGVKGLPLKGEPTPMVSVMERLWSGSAEPSDAQTVTAITADGKRAAESPVVQTGREFDVAVEVPVPAEYYVWEILHEATVTATGGAYEPRPERYGETMKTDTPQLSVAIDDAGCYRVYCYAVGRDGYVGTANIPIKAEGNRVPEN